MVVLWTEKKDDGNVRTLPCRLLVVRSNLSSTLTGDVGS